MIDAEWLLDSSVEQALEETRRGLDSSVPIHTLLGRLRSQWDPSRAAAILEQAELQILARRKFAAADRMRFQRKALQQATGEAVARYKASLFPPGTRGADLCCGLGGDLMALADGRSAIGVERDRNLVLFARHNLAVHNLSGDVVCAEVREFQHAGWDWLHIDPDRRADGFRTTTAEHADPPWSVVQPWFRKASGAVKLAPAAELPPDQAESVHREWIGFHRECREQCVWFGQKLREPGLRSATVIADDGSVARCEGPAEDSHGTGQVPLPGQFLMDPHAAVRAAGLESQLAKQEGLQLVSPASRYLTGPVPVQSKLAQCFEVEVCGRMDLRRLRSLLRSLDVGTVEWKQSGVDQSTFESVSRIRLDGAVHRTVILFRLLDSVHFAIARRL